MFVCWGDLMVLNEVTNWRSVCMFITIRTFCLICFSLPSLHLLLPSLFFSDFHPFVCTCISQCDQDSCSLFTFSWLLTFTRLWDLPWTWPWMPNPSLLAFIFMPSVDIFYTRMVCKSENKMQDKNGTQFILEGKWTIKKRFLAKNKIMQSKWRK